LERPVFVARALTSFLACVEELSAVGFFNISGVTTFDKGVAVRGMKEDDRDGVNGAALGTILDGGLIAGSCGGGWGCACGRLNPGGTEGVEDRELTMS
jgi:hypothetical protein